MLRGALRMIKYAKFPLRGRNDQTYFRPEKKKLQGTFTWKPVLKAASEMRDDYVS